MRQQMVAALLHSPAFQTRRIQMLYRDLLHQSPNRGELRTGLQLLAAGGAIEKLRDRLLASDDYYQHRGHGTGPGFLMALWHDVLPTPPNPMMRANWGGLWAWTSMRSAAIPFLTHSVPAYQKVVRGLFALAGRAVDPAQLGVYVAWLQHGATEDAVLTDMLSSASYFASM
jgi:hypothetical protein